MGRGKRSLRSRRRCFTRRAQAGLTWKFAENSSVRRPQAYAPSTRRRRSFAYGASMHAPFGPLRSRKRNIGSKTASRSRLTCTERRHVRAEAALVPCGLFATEVDTFEPSTSPAIVPVHGFGHEARQRARIGS